MERFILEIVNIAVCLLFITIALLVCDYIGKTWFTFLFGYLVLSMLDRVSKVILRKGEQQ